MIFDGFYGNDNLKRLLTETLKNHTTPHALLIEGERGAGAGYLGELLAGDILCENGGCGACRSCRKALKGIHPDIYVLDRGDEMIKVDDIRALGATAAVYPNDGERKAYVIKHADNMNKNAQNALLKLLEEPPSFVSFILCAESRNKLLDTILSRCVCLKVYPVSADEASDYLIKNTKIKPDAAADIAAVSRGLIGRALTLTDKRRRKRYDERLELCLETLETLCFKSEYAFLKLAKKFSDERDRAKRENEDPAGIFDIQKRLLSDVLHVSHGRSPEAFAFFGERIEALSARLSGEELAALYDICEDTKQLIFRNTNYNACINSFLVRAWEAVNG